VRGGGTQTYSPLQPFIHSLLAAFVGGRAMRTALPPFFVVSFLERPQPVERFLAALSSEITIEVQEHHHRRHL
jgi:hypothetical protein